MVSRPTWRRLVATRRLDGYGAGADGVRGPGPNGSGLDGRVLLAPRDVDLAGLRALGYRNGQPQHAALIGRLDVLQVQVVAQHQLAAEDAPRPLGRQHLPVTVAWHPLCSHRQNVALDVEVDRVLRHTGQVELDPEGVALAPGIHRHHGRSVGGAEQLSGETVEVAERVGGSEQHGCPPVLLMDGYVTSDVGFI